MMFIKKKSHMEGNGSPNAPQPAESFYHEIKQTLRTVLQSILKSLETY